MLVEAGANTNLADAYGRIPAGWLSKKRILRNCAAILNLSQLQRPQSNGITFHAKFSLIRIVGKQSKPLVDGFIFLDRLLRFLVRPQKQRIFGSKMSDVCFCHATSQKAENLRPPADWKVVWYQSSTLRQSLPISLTMLSYILQGWLALSSSARVCAVRGRSSAMRESSASTSFGLRSQRFASSAK